MNKKGTLVTASVSTSLLDPATLEKLPPILLQHATPAIEKKVSSFYLSIADIFERWVARRDSKHTQRAYRQDVMALVKFMGMTWPDDATALLTVSVGDIHAWRDSLLEKESAPKTINRRISSVSSFYKYLGGVATEMRLPITVPNPAHAQFTARSSTDPVKETPALTATRARQLMGLPQGEDLISVRDRAIIKFYLYSGSRIDAGCRLTVGDFHYDEDNPTIRLIEKGDQRRTIGLHVTASDAIVEYIQMAGLNRGPLFRPRTGGRSKTLANRRFDTSSMYTLLMNYLKRLPGAVKKTDADSPTSCLYTPHSLRATTATLLLDAGVDIQKVQELLGHKHVTTTQIYDKRRRTTKESASHDMPI